MGQLGFFGASHPALPSRCAQSRAGFSSGQPALPAPPRASLRPNNPPPARSVVELTFVGGQWRPHELGPVVGCGPCQLTAGAGSAPLSTHGSDPARKQATDSRAASDASTHSWKAAAQLAASMSQPARLNGSGMVDLSPRYSGGARPGPPTRAGLTPLPPMHEEC